MMRYAWLTCLQDSRKPFSVYVSFNKYYRLEPLLISRASAPDDFHAWAIGLIVLATYESAVRFLGTSFDFRNLQRSFELPQDEVLSLVSALERNQPLTAEEAYLARKLSLTKVQQLIDHCCQLTGRSRTILLLDDAALTLTPTYLTELLDIVRALKSSTIAPKASVYPGTTEYGPRFHSGQDSTPVFAWLSVDAPSYTSDMDQIARLRFSAFDSIQPDVVELLRFAAFGIPRAYLTMLQEFDERPGKSAQQTLNQVVGSHLNARMAEFRSLAKKVPKLRILIDGGEKVLNGMVRAIKASNAGNDLLQLVAGIPREDINATARRMFQLLIEAGLIYDAMEVKHGTPERIYQRYIPHASALLQARALTAGDAGGSLKQTAAALHLRRAKHPVRRKLEKYVEDPEVIRNLSFALPPCQDCGAGRLSDGQKFCANCGAQLTASSTFGECLSVPIHQVPGLTEWQARKIREELQHLQTIRDFLAMQDPAAELQTVYGIGRQRSARIVALLRAFVDDFLS